MPPPIFRFAPSPNGYLHLGHAFSALLNFDLARQTGGRWPRDPDDAPLYPGTAKLLSSDQRARLLESDAPYALRLDMAAACARAGNLDWREHGEGPDGEVGTAAARPEAWGDVILARKE